MPTPPGPTVERWENERRCGWSPGRRARGEWSAGVDPHQVVFTLVGAIIHRVLLEHAEPTGPWLEGLVDLVCDGAACRAQPAADR